MSRKGRFTTIARLARGTVFLLSSAPSEYMSWKLVKVSGGVAYVERQHEDKTNRLQQADPQLMVFVPESETA